MGIFIGIATCDPGNWTFNGLPARSVRHLNVIGGVLSSIGWAGSVNAVATNLTRRLESFPIGSLLPELARDINEALAANGSNVQVSASTLGVLSLYALVDWLHTQGVIAYNRPPEEIAKQQLAAPSP